MGLVVPYLSSEAKLPGRDDSLNTRVWVLPSTAVNTRVFLLIHGVGLSHRVYGRLAAQLSRHGTVVGVDLPGFGGIRRPASAVSVHELAACVARAMSDANVKSAVVIGHSMGAQVALELALIAPPRVDALVLIAPVVDPKRHTLLQQGLALARDSAMEPLATKLRVLRDYLACGGLWFLTEAREMMRYRTHAKVAELTVPLLVLRGERDVIAPADWCQWLAGQNGPGFAESVKGHRHVVIHSAPGHTTDLVVDFASQHGRGMSARTVARDLRWWADDYTYALWWQLAALRIGKPGQYLSGDLRPVVILPGVWENWAFMTPVIRALHRAGHPVFVLSDLGRNSRSVVDTAASVSAFLRVNDLRDVVIVAHSKGGLIGKYAMAFLDGEQRITSMVAVCAPFSGSRYAPYLVLPSLRAFSPRDATTVLLGRDRSVNSRIVSIFSEFDPHIPEGSALAGATNIKLPIGGHFKILSDPAALRSIMTAASHH